MMRNIIKKITIFTIAATATISLFGCVNNNTNNNVLETDTNSTSVLESFVEITTEENTTSEITTDTPATDKTDNLEDTSPISEIEALLSNAFGKDNLISGNINLIVTMDVSSYIPEMDTTIAADMYMDSSLVFENNKYYTKGELTATLFGQPIKQSLENYVVIQNNVKKSYEKDIDTNDWFLNQQNNNSGTSSSNAFFKMLDIDMMLCDDLILKEEKKAFKITGTVNADSVLKSLKISGEELFGDFIGAVNVDYNDINVTLTMIFNKETELLEKYIIDFSKFKSERFNLNKMSIELIVNNINNTKLKLPQDLVEYLEFEKDKAQNDEIESSPILETTTENNNTSDAKNETINNIISKDLYNNTGNKICTVTSINGFNFDLKDSSDTLLFLNYSEKNVNTFSISIFNYLTSSIEDFDKGLYKVNLDLYLKDDVSKINTIVTNQGEVTIYKRIFSIFEGVESVEYWVALKTPTGNASFCIDSKYLQKINYTIEQFVQELFR